MAIEKLSLAYVVGDRDQVATFAKEVYFFKDIQVLNTMSEIEAGSFLLPLSQENMEGILGLKDLVISSNKENRKLTQNAIENINNFYEGKLKPDFKKIRNKELNPDEIIEVAKQFDTSLHDKTAELDSIIKERESIENSIEYYSFLSDIDIPMSEINSMENFTCQLGSIPLENVQRLKLIYPSLPSLIFHVGTSRKNEAVYYVVSGKDFRVETERVLKALDFRELKGFNKKYTRKPKEIVKELEKQLNDLIVAEENSQKIVDTLLGKDKERADFLFTELTMLNYINSIEDYMAFSPDKFYFAAWIPTSKKKEFQDLQKNLNLTIQFLEPSDRTIPTKLKNNWLFRPFEQLVRMYGIPNYKELDPTPFFSLTYILFFGYMFGDVGQGAVLLLAGWIAEKKGIELGGIATRCSIASIIFGFLYGSIFGVETIIPALWLRPMEDTNTLLITAVVVGVAMLIIAFVFSLINKSREGERQEEYFGKNGISGFLIYLLILAVGLMVMQYIPDNIVVQDILVGLIVVFTALVFLATPLMNLINHHKFSYDISGDYYATSFFEVFEMFLSMLSNTLSFIRVGAFALTHVGMFMAFQTIAEMSGGGLTGVIVLIIGNIFILVLEGLIDFIQCLRLEFYELFGKYYTGNGIEFHPLSSELQELNR